MNHGDRTFDPSLGQVPVPCDSLILITKCTVSSAVHRHQDALKFRQDAPNFRQVHRNFRQVHRNFRPKRVISVTSAPNLLRLTS